MRLPGRLPAPPHAPSHSPRRPSVLTDCRNNRVKSSCTVAGVTTTFCGPHVKTRPHRRMLACFVDHTSLGSSPRSEHVLGIDLSRCAVESAGKMSAAFPHGHYRQADPLGSDVPSMG